MPFVPQHKLPSLLHANTLEAQHRMRHAGTRLGADPRPYHPTMSDLWALGSFVLLHMHDECPNAARAASWYGYTPRSVELFDDLLHGRSILPQGEPSSLLKEYGPKWLRQQQVPEGLHRGINTLRKRIVGKCTWSVWTELAMLTVLHLVGRCESKQEAFELCGRSSPAAALMSMILEGKPIASMT